jgi:hypothetical protein
VKDLPEVKTIIPTTITPASFGPDIFTATSTEKSKDWFVVGVAREANSLASYVVPYEASNERLLARAHHRQRGFLSLGFDSHRSCHNFYASIVGIR